MSSVKTEGKNQVFPAAHKASRDKLGKPFDLTILGIDPGMARLGWGVIAASGLQPRILNYGVIETTSKQSTAERLQYLHQELVKVIEKYQPEVVAVEKLFFGKNAKTAMLVGEARGVIIFTLSQHHLNYREFTPAEIKIAVTGYGNADKKQIQEMVKTSLRLEDIPKPDDAADALAVAITAMVTKNFKNNINNGKGTV